MRGSAENAVDDVRHYYDENTSRFERFGEGHADGAIHRAVRATPGDGEPSRFRTLDRLVLAELAELAPSFASPLHVLDLGCGVGSSLVYLASVADIRGTGVTLSGVQAERARARVEAHGVEDRIEILEGSYLELPSSLPHAALAFSLEAFIHGPDPAAYFESAARHVAPGGRLVVCDDFLGEKAGGPRSGADERVLTDVREGWLANSLVTAAEANALAERAGFRLLRNVDLSARLELGRPRDHAIRMFVALARKLPLRGYWFRSLLGGSALQAALRRGLIEFRCLTWQRAEDS